MLRVVQCLEKSTSSLVLGESAQINHEWWRHEKRPAQHADVLGPHGYSTRPCMIGAPLSPNLFLKALEPAAAIAEGKQAQVNRHSPS